MNSVIESFLYLCNAVVFAQAIYMLWAAIAVKGMPKVARITFAVSYFLVTSLLVGTITNNVDYVLFLFPMFFGFSFLLGPSIYISAYKIYTQSYRTLFLHLAPMLLVTAGAFYGALAFPLSTEQWLNGIGQGTPVANLGWSYIGNRSLLCWILPLHFMGYGIATFKRTRQVNHLLFISGMNLLLFYVAYSLTHALPLPIHFILSTLVVLVFSIISNFFFFESSSEDLPVESTQALQTMPAQRLTQDPLFHSAVTLYLQDHTKVHHDFTRPKLTLDNLVARSGIPAEEWQAYLQHQGTNFSQLKKKVRIGYALELLNEGYLNDYTVDSLSETVGYKSRTSFYSVFEEITGRPFNAKLFKN